MGPVQDKTGYVEKKQGQNSKLTCIFGSYLNNHLIFC